MSYWRKIKTGQYESPCGDYCAEWSSTGPCWELFRRSAKEDDDVSPWGFVARFPTKRACVEAAERIKLVKERGELEDRAKRTDGAKTYPGLDAVLASARLDTAQLMDRLDANTAALNALTKALTEKKR
jgi:hypothetical protein